MALMMNQDTAALQGAFLLANKLCLPSSLSSLQKADWSTVGHSVLEAVRGVCGQDELTSQPTDWKKKIVCVVWLKALCGEIEDDVEAAWKENPFFPLQNGLPDVNRAVLLELVRSVAAADVFAHMLLSLPRAQIGAELEKLAQHVKSSPTREEDVRLFLEVWWELWKGRDERAAGGADSKEDTGAMFAKEFARVSSNTSGLSPRAAKRLKLDTVEELTPSVTPDVLHILLHTLKDIRDYVSSTDVCHQALSVSLDCLYTAYIIDKEDTLPTKDTMHILSKAVSIRAEHDGKPSPELIHEVQRDLHAAQTPSQFQPNTMTLGEALDIITDLTQFWLNSTTIKLRDGADVTYSAFRLEQSVNRVLAAQDKSCSSETTCETDEDVTKMNTLRGLLKSLTFPVTQTTPEREAEVTMTIINHRLDDHQNFASLFVTEESWACSKEHWLDCLEKNKTLFEQHDMLISLASTALSKLQSDGSDVSQVKKLIKVTADIFSALTLEDKNKSLEAMTQLSTRGFFGHAVPADVTEGFEKELNMTFNCIIQGGGGSSAAASQNNLSTAASLVARVAFQNPEATLRSCCHSAIFNKGAFSLMAKILQQLPGLRGQTEGIDESARSQNDYPCEEKKAESDDSLLCRCLQNTIEKKSLSAGEKEQFLKFVELMMSADGEERSRCFLTPQEVVNVFVLPYVSKGNSVFDIELTLKLLHTALCVDVQHQTSSPHWVLGCSPFPLLYILAQLLNQTLRLWERPPEGSVHHWSMETKELLESVLATLAQVVGVEVAAAPDTWSRALFWLYDKVEELDWTVRFHLKPVWGEHFKNEVPLSLLAVCDLPEQEWTGLDLPQYGQGSGLLPWLECCSLSDPLRITMLSCLSLDQRRSDHVNMFSKGLLVALTQTLPWCTVSQWSRLLETLRELIASGRLHVPFSLEYVDHLPLLDLRRFSCELRLSVLLLRVLQLLCGSSCSDWLSEEGWTHVGRLYAHATREMLNSVKAKLLLEANTSCTSPIVTEETTNTVVEAHDTGKSQREEMEMEMEKPASQEVLFVLSQLFCHVQHIQVMMPAGQCEPLFLSSLEILSHYEAVMAAFPDSSSALESDNTRHFFSTITDNLENQEMKAVLQQKIAQLVVAVEAR